MLVHATNVGIFASHVKANVPYLVQHDCGMGAKRPKPEDEPPSAALNILGDNLRALRDASADFDSDAKIGAKAGMDQKTVWRIINKKNEPTTLQISRLAGVFELEPWKLFVPNLEPTNAPMLATESANLRKMLKTIGATKEAIEGFLRDEGNTTPGGLT